MGFLWDLASADNKAILENESGGFGIALVLTDPSETTAALVGMPTDIGLGIDPETQQLIASRQASIAIRLDSIRDAGLEQPRGIADASSKPWRVTFQLPSETAPRTYKIVETMPDRLGLLVCFLEEYLPSA